MANGGWLMADGFVVENLDLFFQKEGELKMEN